MYLQRQSYMSLQGKGDRNDDERLLPLINMVFLLLIFFMLAGKLTAEQIKIEPPLSSSQEDPSSPPVVILSMDAQGRLFLNAEVVPQDNLQLALTQYPDVGSMDSPLVLRASAAAEATKVVTVMSRLRDAGIDQLQLLTIADHR